MKTRDEVLEYSGAFLQLYREEGWYLERTVHYVARVGPRLREEDGCSTMPKDRRALWERLQFALDGEPDPWFELTSADRRAAVRAAGGVEPAARPPSPLAGRRARKGAPAVRGT